MAKSSNTTKPKPAISEGYPGIIYFTFLVMLAAVGMLAYELNEEYEWQSEPKSAVVAKPTPVPPRNAPADKGAPAPAPMP